MGKTTTALRALAVLAAAAVLTGCSGEATYPDYQLPVTSEEGGYVLTVHDLAQPVEAAAPWGAYSPTNGRFVALDLEVVEPDAAWAPLVRGSCFELGTDDGSAPPVAFGFVTDGATLIDEAEADAEGRTRGQLVFEVPEGVDITSVAFTCTSGDVAVIAELASP